MDLLPPHLEREWLWAALHSVIERRGEATLLAAPIVRPTDDYFPDRWTPDEHGVAALARRLLGYAALDLDVSVEMFTGETDVREVGLDGKASSTSHDGAAAWFAGIDHGKVARFGAEQSKLDDPLGLVAAMAHEAAHAFRRHHRLEHRDRDVEERLTDVTTVYLGFGLLTTAASARFTTWRVGNTGNAWTHQRQGYLAPQALAFLLATQLSIRGYDAKVAKWYARQLPANQAACLLAAFAELQRPQVADVLGFDAVPDPQPAPALPKPWWQVW